MNIETSRLIIKSIDDSSLNYIIKCIDNPYLNIPLPKQPSYYHKKKFLTFNAKIKTFNSLGYFEIILKKNLETIGMISIVPRYLNENLINELGYLIFEKYRNCGFAYEAILNILAFVFSKTDINSIYSLVDKGNLISKHILENKIRFDLVDIMIDKNNFKNLYTIDKNKFMKKLMLCKNTNI